MSLQSKARKRLLAPSDGSVQSPAHDCSSRIQKKQHTFIDSDLVRNVVEVGLRVQMPTKACANDQPRRDGQDCGRCAQLPAPPVGTEELDELGRVVHLEAVRPGVGFEGDFEYL
jgi:hypothetical protein